MNSSFEKEPIILLVDDIPDNLKVLGNILKNYGYKVRPITNGMQALKIAEKETPDLILLDIMMPEVDGYELCKMFKEIEQTKDVPIIFISALNDVDDIVKAFQIGGVDYITKPFKVEEVLARVGTHIKLRRQTLEFQKINAMKDKFFSIIAHDLRNPLGNFRNVTQLLVDSYHNYSEEYKFEFLKLIKDSANNIFALLENLLEWSRSQRGLLELNPTEFELKRIVIDTIDLHKLSCDEKNVFIDEYISDDIIINADPNLIKTILRNLVSNAIKFTTPGGLITIKAEAGEENTKIQVSDTGVGMTQETIDKLFRIDVNFSTLGTSKEKGTGLGLILCKEFVERHGGEIWAESEVGKGSTFCFTIPK